MNFSVFIIGTVCLFAGLTESQFIDWCSPIGHEKISYGETAQKGELKYQVQIRWYGDLVCGGTLIKAGPEQIQAVLTTASCLTGPNPFFYSIQAGDWDLDNYMDQEQVREVDQFHFPDNYNTSRPYENDIAIITLREPFDIDNMTSPIALPDESQQLNPNITLLASGWGQWYPLLDEFTCRLQKVAMPQVEKEMCQRIYTEYGVQLSDSMFCVGQMDAGDGLDVGIGPCGVDFGGPLVNIEGAYLAGIMSYNYRCSYVGYPVVSTYVPPYVSWIKRTLNASREAI